MPHYLIKKDNIINGFVELSKESGNDTFFHLTKVLRVKINQELDFIDSEKTLYETKIVSITKDKLISKIIKKSFCDRFLNYNICLIQSILMTDAQNLLISNATQSGVKEIYPVISDNTSVKKSTVQNEIKLEKWNKIALGAFEQCQRADIALIHPVMELKDALSKFKKENIIIFAECNQNCDIDESLIDVDKNSKIALVIGPEGGFSKDEFEYFKNQNYKLATLGKLIYKAPNAVVAAVSNIVSRLQKD